MIEIARPLGRSRERVAESAGAALEARGVWKWFGGDRAVPPVLREIDLSLPPGSFTALTGTSGSGKTTLLSLLGALDRPSQGEIRIDGQPLGRMTDIALARIRRGMGFIFQDYALIPRLPLWENVTYPLVPRGMGIVERKRRAEEVMTQVGLEGFEGKPPELLSGGERQRVAIARALATEPRMVLADEPTASLDEASASAVRAILRDLNEGGVTIVLATHDAELASLADRQFRLAGGALSAGTP